MPKLTEEQKLMRKWWVLLVLGLCFGALSYGFVSLAIDSGSLWQYALGIGFLVWGVNYLFRSARVMLGR